MLLSLCLRASTFCCHESPPPFVLGVIRVCSFAASFLRASLMMRAALAVRDFVGHHTQAHLRDAIGSCWASIISVRFPRWFRQPPQSIPASRYSLSHNQRPCLQALRLPTLFCGCRFAFLAAYHIRSSLCIRRSELVLSSSADWWFRLLDIFTFIKKPSTRASTYIRR